MFDMILEDTNRWIAQAAFLVGSGLAGLMAGAWVLPLLVRLMA